MPKVLSFADALERTKGGARTLLIGNGFSAQYFSYRTLLAESGLEEEPRLYRLFEALETVDFEAVVHALEEASIVEEAYENNDHAHELQCHAQQVREALVRAVNSTHPRHRGELELQYDSSAEFLANFQKVFTLNYDLLLYWVNLEKQLLRDGFGLGSESSNGRFLGPFNEGAYCEIFNLHGGLHLFPTQIGEIRKALDTGSGVIETITKTILEGSRLPIYVAEGTSKAKLRKINSSPYLRHCYDKLCENRSTVFVFGHSAADNDEHIFEAMFGSQIEELYFGVYQPDDEKIRYFDSQLAKYQRLYGADVEYSFYDAESAHVWDGPSED